MKIMDVEALTVKYLAHCEHHKQLSEKSIKAYRIDLRQYLVFTSGRYPLEKTTLLDYIAHLHASYQPKTAKRKIACLKAFCAWLEFEELLTVKASCDHIIVAWRGDDYFLSGSDARLWLAGHSDTSLAEAARLKYLEKIGLAETGDTDGPMQIYRLLTNCAACPAPWRFPRWPLRRRERVLWQWINRAGTHLTLAELVFLLEHSIQPEPELLGEANRNDLLETIHPAKPIDDRLLEARMEDAFDRDAIVDSLLALLRKKYITLV